EGSNAPETREEGLSEGPEGRIEGVTEPHQGAPRAGDAAESGSGAEGTTQSGTGVAPLSGEEKGILLARTSRALVVLGLLGMGLCTWAWLSFHAGLREALLGSNELEGPVRVTFLVLLIGSGVLSAGNGFGPLPFLPPGSAPPRLDGAA